MGLIHLIVLSAVGSAALAATTASMNMNFRRGESHRAAAPAKQQPNDEEGSEEELQNPTVLHPPPSVSSSDNNSVMPSAGNAPISSITTSAFDTAPDMSADIQKTAPQLIVADTSTRSTTCKESEQLSKTFSSVAEYCSSSSEGKTRSRDDLSSSTVVDEYANVDVEIEANSIEKQDPMEPLEEGRNDIPEVSTDQIEKLWKEIERKVDHKIKEGLLGKGQFSEKTDNEDSFKKTQQLISNVSDTTNNMNKESTKEDKNIVIGRNTDFVIKKVSQDNITASNNQGQKAEKEVKTEFETLKKTNFSDRGAPTKLDMAALPSGTSVNYGSSSVTPSSSSAWRMFKPANESRLSRKNSLTNSRLSRKDSIGSSIGLGSPREMSRRLSEKILFRGRRSNSLSWDISDADDDEKSKKK